jgi:hypothetical protein
MKGEMRSDIGNRAFRWICVPVDIGDSAVSVRDHFRTTA